MYIFYRTVQEKRLKCNDKYEKTDMFLSYPACSNSFHCREFSWMYGKPNCNHWHFFHPSYVLQMISVVIIFVVDSIIGRKKKNHTFQCNLSNVASLILLAQKNCPFYFAVLLFCIVDIRDLCGTAFKVKQKRTSVNNHMEEKTVLA